MKKFKLLIITPEGKLFDDSVDFVAVPGVIGEFGVFADHAPFVTISSSGDVRVTKDKVKSSIKINKSLVEVYKNSVTIFIDNL